MAIFRNRPREQFTQIRNKALRDVNLTLRAKGLLAEMLSFPDDWDFSIKHLITLSADGRDAHYAAAEELAQAGYLAKIRERDKKGRMGSMVYIVSDDCLSISGLPGYGLTVSGETGTTNTDSRNTDDTNKKHMSSDDDATPLDGSELPQDERQGASGTDGAVTVGEVQSGAKQSPTKALEDFPGAAAGAAPDALELLRRRLVNIWNEHRGDLPEIRVKSGPECVSAKRAKMLNGMIKDLGADEVEAIWLDAVKEVAKSKHWQENAYGLESLTRHAEAKAAAYRAKAGRAPEVKPSRDGYDGKGWV